MRGACAYSATRPVAHPRDPAPARANPHGRASLHARAEVGGTHPPALDIASSRATGTPWKELPLPGTTRPPSHLHLNRLRKINRLLRLDRIPRLEHLLGPDRPVRLERLLDLSRPLRLNRAMTLIFLGTALALAGAGTASAATSSPVTSSHAAVAQHTTAREAKAQHRKPHPAALSARHGPKHRPASAAHRAAARQPAAHHRRHHHHHRSLNSWRAIIHAAAGKKSGWLPASDRLLPAGLSGPQAFMPLTASREANATTIVRQALKKHMGLRSAVIAVATAMQESSLENLTYGDRDSLGLFQQRPSMGWGSPAEVTNPTYASDAFLSALRQYQASHGAWATQPLWEAAQGVQNSGFPYAYAKWEDQAA